MLLHESGAYADLFGIGPGCLCVLREVYSAFSPMSMTAKRDAGM